MVLSGLVSWCQRADSCNGWSVRDKGGVGRNYDHNRKFFFTTKKGKTMEEKVRKIRKKRVFTMQWRREGNNSVFANKCNLRKKHRKRRNISNLFRK